MSRTKVFNENDVLEKAVQVFRCKGYNGTSAQDLVDELGISRSSLYDTYGDKRSLFVRALQHYRSTSSNGLIEMIKNSDNIEETIGQIFEIAVKEALEDKLYKGCFMVNTTIELAPHDKDIAAIISQNMVDIEQALCVAIKKGQDNGVLSKKQSAVSLARFVFNNISGLRVAAKLDADKKVYDDIIKVIMSVLKV
jgi:TetR/AcrR family transcriptional regulator, transcriptional repressor for nem operon